MEQATGFADHRYEDSNVCSRAYDGQCDYASYQPCLIAVVLAVLDELPFDLEVRGDDYESAAKVDVAERTIRAAARAYYGGTLREVSHA